jgi:hypothetical protein
VTPYKLLSGEAVSLEELDILAPEHEQENGAGSLPTDRC